MSLSGEEYEEYDELEEAEDVHPLGFSGNHFRTIDELAEETTALCGHSSPSPRFISRTTPRRRKAKNHNQYMQELSTNFGLLTGAITSSLIGGNQGAAGELERNNITERFMMLNEHVSSVSGEVSTISASLHAVSSDLHAHTMHVDSQIN